MIFVGAHPNNCAYRAVEVHIVHVTYLLMGDIITGLERTYWTLPQSPRTSKKFSRPRDRSGRTLQ
jgi:hypothetical protein